MIVFQFDDYKEAFLNWVAETPKGGHGQFRKLSQALNVSSVFITQVFRGDRDLSLDQAFETALFMRLSGLEIDYFVLLVQERRAGGHRLKSWLAKKRREIRAQARELKRQLPQDAELSGEAQSEFYSHWHYSAIRLLTSIPGYETADKISERLHIPSERVHQILNFLSEHRLIVPIKIGWKMGPQATHLEAGSPFILSRQVQWRTKGFEAMAQFAPEHLFYTGPMSLDEKTFLEIRELLAQALKKSLDRVRDSKSELLACLNIDWFRF